MRQTEAGAQQTEAGGSAAAGAAGDGARTRAVADGAGLDDWSDGSTVEPSDAVDAAVERIEDVRGDAGVPVTTVGVAVPGCRVRSDFDGELSGLVAHYAFEGDADDRSGNAFHGALHGGAPATDAQGREGGAVAFDGEDDYAVVADDPALALDSFTISLVVKAPPTAADNWVLSRGALYGNYSVLINAVEHAWPLQAAYVHAIPSVGNYSSVMSRGPVAGDEFVALAIVIDGEGDGLTATTYANGARAHGPLPAREPDTAPAALYLGAGGYYEPLTDHFTGTLDDVRIYDRPLTAEEIARLHCK